MKSARLVAAHMCAHENWYMSGGSQAIPYQVKFNGQLLSNIWISKSVLENSGGAVPSHTMHWALKICLWGVELSSHMLLSSMINVFLISKFSRSFQICTWGWWWGRGLKPCQTKSCGECLSNILALQICLRVDGVGSFTMDFQDILEICYHQPVLFTTSQ